jgi:hypothetical protein
MIVALAVVHATFQLLIAISGAVSNTDTIRSFPATPTRLRLHQLGEPNASRVGARRQLPGHAWWPVFYRSSEPW